MSILKACRRVAIILSTASLVVGGVANSILPVHAATPAIINYQGRLTNAAGDLQNGTFFGRFEIFSDLTAGTRLWPAAGDTGTTASTSNVITLTVTNGAFTVPLADTTFDADMTAFPTTLFTSSTNDSTVFLQVSVSSASGFTSAETLSPRQQVLSSPFALNAETLDGFDSTQVGAASSAVVTNAAQNIIFGTTSTGIDTTGGILQIGGTASGSAGSTVSICNSANCDTITIGNNADLDTITIGDLASADTVTIQGDVAISDAQWTISAAGAGAFASLTTTAGAGLDAASAGTLALGNVTATTVSIGGTAATTLNLGAGGALTRTINIGTGTGADTINIGTGATGADAINIGTGSAAGNAVVIGANQGGMSLAIDTADWDITTTGVMTGISGLTSDGLITGQLGLTITGGPVNLVANGSSDANIATGTSTGNVNIGHTQNLTSTQTGTITVNGGAGGIIMTTDLTAPFSVTTGTTGAVTIETGTTGAINIGINANAKAITLGNTGVATTLAYNTGATTGNGFTVTANALTSGYAQKINVAGTTVLTTGGALDIDGPTGISTMNATTGLVNISSTGAFTNSTTGAASGSLFQITGNGAITPTLASISDTSVMTTTGRLLDLTANSATTTTGLFTVSANGLTTGTAEGISSSATTSLTTAGANTGSLLDITESGAMTAFTGSIASINTSGANAVGATGSLLNINNAGTADLMKLLTMNSASTASTNSLMSLTSAVTAAPSNGIVRFNFNGIRTGAGSGFLIDDVSTTLATVMTLNGNSLSTGNGVAINTNVLTTGKALGVTSSATTSLTTAGANTGSLLDITESGAMTAFTGSIASINTSGANAVGATGSLLNINNAGTADLMKLLTMNSASTASTNSLMSLTSAVTAAPSNGIVRFNFNGIRTGAGSGFLIDDVSTTLATVMTLNGNSLSTGNGVAINTNVLTTGKALGVTSSATTSLTTAGANTGSLLDITESGAMTAFTGSLASINTSGANAVGATGSLLNINNAGTADLMKLLTMNSASTAVTNSLMSLTSASTAAFGNGGVRFNFTGAHTGNGFQIDDVTATGTGVALATNSLTTGIAQATASTSAVLTSGKLLSVTWNPATYTGAGITGNLAQIVDSPTVTTSVTGSHNDLNVTRTNTINSAGITYVASGSIAKFVNALSVITAGTAITNNASVLDVQQNDTVGTRTTGATFAITDLTGAGTGNSAESITANSLTTSTGALTINATALTSGYAQHINVAGSTTLTTGGAINVDGPTSTATLNATTGLVNISSTGAFTNSTTGAASGSLFQITGNGAITPTLASISDTSVMTTTGRLLDLTADAATTVTGLFTISASGLTTGTAEAISSASNVLTSGKLLSATYNPALVTGVAAGQLVSIVDSPTVNITVASTLNDLNITRTNTTTATAITFTPSGSIAKFVNASPTIGSTSAITDTAVVLDLQQNNAASAGTVLAITNIATGNSSFTISSAGTTGAVTVASITANLISTSKILALASSATTQITTAGANAGSMLDITESGAMTAFTGSIASINLSGANAVGATGSALNINIAGTAQLMQGIKFSDASTGALGTTIATSGGALFNFSGAHTGYGFQISDVTTGGVPLAITDAAAMTSGSAGIKVLLTGVAEAGTTTTTTSGILIAMPSATLNTLRYIRFTAADGTTEIGSINNTNSTTTAYATSSDRRLKGNIVDTHLGLSDLMKIGVKDYTWNSSGEHDNGFIAQDLYTVYPNAVTKGDNGTDAYVAGVTNTWEIDYGRVTPIIVKAIQDQQGLLGDFTNGASGFIADVQAETAHDPVSIVAAKISGGANFLADFTAARVTAIRGYFDEVFANKTHQKTLCVGDANNGGETCITKTELDSMLQNQNSSASAPAPTPAPAAPAPVVESSSTPAPASDSSTPASEPVADAPVAE